MILDGRWPCHWNWIIVICGWLAGWCWWLFCNCNKSTSDIADVGVTWSTYQNSRSGTDIDNQWHRNDCHHLRQLTGRSVTASECDIWQHRWRLALQASSTCEGSPSYVRQAHVKVGHFIRFFKRGSKVGAFGHTNSFPFRCKHALPFNAVLYH